MENKPSKDDLSFPQIDDLPELEKQGTLQLEFSKTDVIKMGSDEGDSIEAFASRDTFLSQKSR